MPPVPCRWQDSPSPRRLPFASLAARRRGDSGKGRLLSVLGGGVLTAGGFLGGHLSFAESVGPNQTAFDPGPSEWTQAARSDAVVEGEPTRVVVDETPVLLVRSGEVVHALHDRCSHRGCSLSDMGEMDGDVIECSCHGSRFSVLDGSLQRGPATAPQPHFEVRESDGQVEVRLPDAG